MSIFSAQSDYSKDLFIILEKILHKNKVGYLLEYPPSLMESCFMSQHTHPADTHPATMPENANLGIMFGGIAALIWGAWPIVTAIGVKADFTPYELVFLRLSIAGVLLLPWAFRGDTSLKAWGHSLMLTVLAGGTYSYMSASGFQYASAMHGGVIIPGTVMLISLFASHLWLGDSLTRNRLMGAASITLGLGLLAAGSPAQANGQSSLLGDAFFLVAGIMWAGYTLLLRVWPMDPIVVTARISLLSLIGFLAFYPVSDGIDFTDVPTSMLLLQAVWQGLLSAVIAIVFFNKGVAILGAARAGVVNALIPVIAMILAFLILSEVPTGMEQLGLLFIMAGIGIIMVMKQKAPKTAPLTP